MKNNNNILKLPEWFDREKYKSSEDLTFIDWALNLLTRKHILETIEEESADDVKHLFSTEIRAIHDDGVLKREYTKDLYEGLEEVYGAEKDKPGFGVVYSLLLDDAVKIHEEIQADTKLRCDLATRSYHNDMFFEKRWGIDEYFGNNYLGTVYDEHYDRNYFYRSHLVVELEATDEIVLEAFKSWLFSMREREKEISCENSGHPKKLTDNLRKKWVNAEIPPFIDLEIYQQLEDIRLPLHLIGNAIFSDKVDFDTTEAVRKTTRKLARLALEQSNAILRHALIIEKRTKRYKN